MLQKQYIPSRDVTRVIFKLPQDELPEHVKVRQIVLVGDFNDWDPEEHFLRFDAEANAYQIELELAPGSEHQFRYCLNDSIWLSDQQADALVPTRVGADNSVVIATPAPN